MRLSASLAKRSARRRSASLVSAVLAVSDMLRSSAAFARSSVAVRWESGAVICIRVWASFGALGMHENRIRMVNRRLGRLPVGEGENFVGHLEQSARDRIVGRICEPSQVASQVRKVGSDIFHRSGTPNEVADSGVWATRDRSALIWINWGTRGEPGQTSHGRVTGQPDSRFLASGKVHGRIARSWPGRCSSCAGYPRASARSGR